LVCFVYLDKWTRELYLSELYSPHVLTEERPATDFARVGDMQLVAIEMRTMMMLRDALIRQYISMFVMALGGGSLVGMALAKWRQHLHLGLIAKLLRAKLETERGALAGGAPGNTET